jgi:hypothetical protein
MYFMVGELIMGRDLRRVARRARERGARVPRVIVAEIIAKVCLGLHEAHELTDADGVRLNLVHRDISSNNILVSFKGSVKLIDFGIAWAKGRLSHTDVRSAKGKVGYMAPEQLRGEPVDRRADIFSLGVVLYMAATGKRPFPGDSVEERQQKVLRGDFPAPREADPSVDAELERIILKAMQGAVDRRYATAAAMGEDLQEYAKTKRGGGGTAALAKLMAWLFKEEIKEHNDRIREHRLKMGEHTGSVPVYGTSSDGPDTDPVHTPSGDPGVDTAVVSSGRSDARQARSRRRRRRSALAIAGVLFIGVIAASIYGLSGETDERAAGSGESPAVEETVRQPEPVAEENPGAVRAESERDLPEPAATGPKAASHVKVDLAGIPSGADVFLDGKAVTPPISVERSARPVILKVTASGYAAFEKAIVLSEDQTIEVSMVRKPRAPRRTAGRTDRKTREPRLKERRADGWEDNPFR